MGPGQDNFNLSAPLWGGCMVGNDTVFGRTWGKILYCGNLSNLHESFLELGLE